MSTKLVALQCVCN